MRVVMVVALTACGRVGFAPVTGDAPAPCVPVVDVAAVDVGRGFACARLTDGTARCWGAGNIGQIGDGALTSRPTPVAVPRLAGVTAIAVGLDHACALAAGRVACWGRNDTGQLGINALGMRPGPVEVVGLPGDVVGIAAGGMVSCAWTAGGDLWCWGQRNGSGSSDQPVRIATPTGVTQVALSTAGRRGSVGVVELAAGGETTCARRADASVWCWGDNDELQLAREGADAVVPELVATDARAIAVGTVNACALGLDGVLRCWGSDRTGLVSGELAPDASDVVALAGAFDLDAGGDATSALLPDGEVRCWGAGALGQLGAGVQPARSAPGPVALAAPATQVSVGSAHACVRHASGAVSCWGDNEDGRVTGEGASWSSPPAPSTPAAAPPEGRSGAGAPTAPGSSATAPSARRARRWRRPRSRAPCSSPRATRTPARGSRTGPCGASARSRPGSAATAGRSRHPRRWRPR